MKNILDIVNIVDHSDAYGHSRGQRVMTRLGSRLSTSMRDTNRRGGFERAATNPGIIAAGIRQVEKYIEDLNEGIGERIEMIRLRVNRWDSGLGINLASVALMPHIGGEEVDLKQYGKIKPPTVGLMPELRRGTLAQAGDEATDFDAPVTGVLVGFGVDEGAEILHALGPLRACVVPQGTDLSNLLQRPKDNGRRLTFDFPSVNGPGLVAAAGKMVVVHVPCFDLEKLRASGLPHCLAHGVQNRSFSLNQHLDQGYFCDYPTTSEI